MYQVMQSVKVRNDQLAQHNQAGHVTKDNTKLVDGVSVGTVEVKMDIENEVFEFDVKDLEGL
jgi:hypothetical protein